MATKGLIIGGGLVCTLGSSDVQVIADGGVRVVGDKIDSVATTAELRAKHPADEYHDVHGAMIIPGLICAHGHFYGLFSRGMSLHDDAPANFMEVLERLWWRIDRALDDESNTCSALGYSCAALRSGCTTIIDHHSSPTHTLGSLDRLAEATKQVGVRSCLCYEVTDRNGPQKAQEGIDENVRWAKRCMGEKDPMLAASFGMHASFTISDETMDKCVKAVREDLKGTCGFHIHCAEDLVDETLCEKEHNGKRIAKRLSDWGVLGPKTVIGHGVHLDASELDMVAKSGSMVVTNIQSNMNNAVGLPDVLGMKAAGIAAVGLGTDGIAYDMIDEFKTCAFALKLRAKDPRVGTVEAFNQLFRGNSEIATRLFNQPMGKLEPGYMADITVLDYHSPTPVAAGALPWHFLFGVNGSRDVSSVYVAGKKVVDNHKILTVDEHQIALRCQKVTPVVWHNMEQIVKDDKMKSSK